MRGDRSAEARDVRDPQPRLAPARPQRGGAVPCGGEGGAGGEDGAAGGVVEDVVVPAGVLLGDVRHGEDEEVAELGGAEGDGVARADVARLHAFGRDDASLGELVPHDLVARHDAQLVDERLRLLADRLAHGAPVLAGVKDRQVDIRVGVRRVEEPQPAEGVGLQPQPEYVVALVQVLLERAVLVPALAGAAPVEQREQRGQ
mmetsp:Transcript_34988/g.87096  ORF Transcript_34988/g.87096 Transcript_34988/m.87096 type:complete len:202 (+) Transcript_34988:678-1283(+)